MLTFTGLHQKEVPLQFKSNFHRRNSVVDLQQAMHAALITPMVSRINKLWYRSSADDPIQHFTAVFLSGF